MDLSELENLPVKKVKARAIVRCGDEFVFIKRTKTGKKSYLTFPGGRLEKSDRPRDDKKNIGRALITGLKRELEEELAAREIVVGPLLSVRKRKGIYEALFDVTVAAINWDAKTGDEFKKSNKGEYELVVLDVIDKKRIGKSGLNLKPKKWRKLLVKMCANEPIESVTEAT